MVGYMIANKYEPATTLWELWNSDDQGPGMNSRNHIMFGSISSYDAVFTFAVIVTTQAL